MSDEDGPKYSAVYYHSRANAGVHLWYCRRSNILLQRFFRPQYFGRFMFQDIPSFLALVLHEMIQELPLIFSNSKFSQAHSSRTLNMKPSFHDIGLY